jgi:competence protein ComEC
LPGAQSVIPQVPLASAIALALGASFLCLASRQAKYASGILLIAGIAMMQFDRFPDLLVERTAANAAFRNGSGELVFANSRRGRFAAEKWLQANGEEITFRQAAARAGWSCEARSCRSEIKGKVIGYFLDGEGVPPACTGFDIVIAAYPLRGTCKSVSTRIDRFDVWRMGSHAIVIESGATVVTTARGVSGNRPWVVVPEPRRKIALTR